MDRQLKELDGFHGTNRYHKVVAFTDIVATDGVAYVVENGYHWFVNDALIAITEKLRNEEFLVVRLRLSPPAARMEITDGDGKVMYTQDYSITDAEVPVEFYVTNKVALLPGEM